MNKQIVILFLIDIIFLGAIFNILAISTNGGRMPVKDLGYETNIHSSYENYEDINFPIYSDRFNIGDSIVSLGDIIMFLSMLLITIMVVWDITCQIIDKKKGGMELGRRKSQTLKVFV